MRVGFGYDVHKLVKDRPLILCGVTIPFELGLLGHSDADVATHSLMDSILGALALGDIGTFFPDTDDKYKNISSMILLEEVMLILNEKKYIINNIDLTIVAQKPKILPYVNEMRKSLSEACCIDIDNINVKATTEEYLGFTGNLEGMKSICVVTILKK
ncbi:MAG: 2-C-methyl-D-erythritol 2,4-cyclodiphosphate synthase [Lachnospirales bacterium]